MTTDQWRELRDDESPQKGDQARFENGDVLTVTSVGVPATPFWRVQSLDLPGVRFFREVPERALPTTDEVHDAYLVARVGGPFSVKAVDASADFDAWLAGRDARIQRDARAEVIEWIRDRPSTHTEVLREAAQSAREHFGIGRADVETAGGNSTNGAKAPGQHCPGAAYKHVPASGLPGAHSAGCLLCGWVPAMPYSAACEAIARRHPKADR